MPSTKSSCLYEIKKFYHIQIHKHTDRTDYTFYSYNEAHLVPYNNTTPAMVSAIHKPDYDLDRRISHCRRYACTLPSALCDLLVSNMNFCRRLVLYPYRRYTCPLSHSRNFSACRKDFTFTHLCVENVTGYLNEVVTNTIRLRFDGRSTAYQRLVRSQWRNSH